jgi:hypothetical protein
MSLNSIKNLTNINPSKKITNIVNSVTKKGNTIFLFNNLFAILIVFLIILFLTIFFISSDISFKKKEYVVDKSYIKEGMNVLEKAKKNILKKKCTDASDQQKMCLENDQQMCNKLNCCVWVNYNKHGMFKKPSCVKGGANGPSSKKKCDKKDKECKLGFDEFYYKGIKNII